jgi:hypothetical protein
MNTSPSVKSNEIPGSFSRTAVRWFLLVAAGATLVAIATVSWNWLVPAGVASVLLSILPCLVMCGLGLCAHKLIGRITGVAAITKHSRESTSGSFAAAADNMSIGASSCCGGHVPAGTSLGRQIIEAAEKEAWNE